jgi:hypothetical protein
LNQPAKVVKREDDKPPIKKSDYARMTLIDLKAIAAERNIVGRSKLKQKLNSLQLLKKLMQVKVRDKSVRLNEFL